jgi:Kyakuja-Dileera-Zisupton transposase
VSHFGLLLSVFIIFIQPTDSDKVTPCEDCWKNMANEINEKTRGMYDETEGFLAFCHHGFVLVIIDMIQSGEL